jgi:hypothetical protein
MVVDLVVATTNNNNNMGSSFSFMVPWWVWLPNNKSKGGS